MFNKELEEKSYKVSSKVLPAKKTQQIWTPLLFIKGEGGRGWGQEVRAGGVEFLKFPKKARS